MRHKRRPPRDYDDEDSLGDDLAAVHDRLDDLTRQLERVARSNVARRSTEEERAPDRVAEAIAKLDRRLDQVIAESRSAAAEVGRRAVARMMTVPPPPAAAPQPEPRGPAAWAMEISARQRALDGEPPVPAPRAPGPDLSGLEHHLRHITDQIASLHQPYEDALTALRTDLAEIGRALTEALPRRAVEALETEVRTLADRLSHGRHTGSADAGALAGLERGLAEVRETLQRLTPAESLVGVDEAVRGLSRKLDQISLGQHDPAAYQQLEQAIGSLRAAVSNVASDGALAQLAAEVHGLAGKVERVAAGGSSEALAKLDARIEALMNSGRAVPPDLEASIRTLSDRLERIPLGQGDQVALGTLEDRIAKLCEKLDAAEARLGGMSGIERGIADIMVHLEEMRGGNGGARGPRSAAPEPEKSEPAPSLPPAGQLQKSNFPVLPPEPAPALAPLPPVQVFDSSAPAPDTTSLPPTHSLASRPRSDKPKPIDPSLPPDTPIEPGSGVPRIKPGSPAARIAASEAALGGAKPPPVEIGSSAAVAAARSAAKSALAEAPGVAAPKGKKEPAIEIMAAPKGPLSKRLLRHGKAVLIGASVIIIVLGAIQVAKDYLPGRSPAETSNPPSRPTAPRPMPAPGGTVPATPSMPDDDADAPGRGSSLFDPSTLLSRRSPADVTGSVGRQAPPRNPAALGHAGLPPVAQNGAADALPASIGPALRAAVAGNDPAAEYEVAVRYAEGRGMPQNLEEAARWLERAAKSGFAPAQFRLASLYERGDGLKKDLQAARRLYLAAADKGHAKAMHNLAVLHAEGIDGKPDYRIAAQWFRKAATYGVADSQYNLAILFARGIGVEQNLAEAYKWFALAASKGDHDATRKRDDVGARLDQSSLMAARLAAQTFTAEREPEEATSLRVPPGGWDRGNTTVQPVKPKGRGAGSP